MFHYQNYNKKRFKVKKILDQHGQNCFIKIVLLSEKDTYIKKYKKSLKNLKKY